MAKDERREELFAEIGMVANKIDYLKGIVQNSEMDISDEQLTEWVDNVNDNINHLNSVKEDVIRLYQG